MSYQERWTCSGRWRAVSEETRQKWIGVAMDLMVAYYRAQEDLFGEFPRAKHPDVLIRPYCDRVADAVGDGATGEFVWELLQERLRATP